VARRALTLRPESAEGWIVLGNIRRAAGALREASQAQARALLLRPDSVTARYNLGVLQLQQGDLQNGWEGYRHRFGLRTDGRLGDRGLPAWNGQPAPERALLIWPEQGIGDEITFASCFAEVGWRFRSVVLEVDPRIAPLFRRSFPQFHVVALGEALPPGDYLQSPSGNVAGFLRPDLAAFPVGGAYLRPDPALRGRWRSRLDALGPGVKVGLLWRGRVAHGGDTYPGLPAFSALLRLSGCRFISLQYGDAEAELTEWEAGGGPGLVRWPDLDLLDDFENVAALMSELDVVVSPGTAAAALAGALGVPAWVLAGHDSWMTLGTDRYPWFPSLRLFRRDAASAWSVAAGRVADELTRLAASTARSAPDSAP
jgi:hypothetical protein